ncbi:unnamed protein product [Ranitomeya imitator]|uniref:PTB domain-containing protein n=1 Tax=Ranitomeya imitator TaxID=111125 RepID=A0ABN9LMB9_9NEOB|nr:unnamed protein product [Ranitomeya imitator]
MDKNDSLGTEEDAIKRLFQLETKDKIWAQEMVLQVMSTSISLLDCATQEELENFPLSIVHKCRSIQGPHRYPHLLLIVCQEVDQSKPDIHFFNCEIEAEMVHDDIQSALADIKLGNKMRPQTLKANQERIRQRESILPPTTAPKSVMRDNKNRVIPPNAEIEFDRRSNMSQEAEESREALAKRIERDTQCLNCTLDDIEYFVAKLKKSSTSFPATGPEKERQKEQKERTSRNPASLIGSANRPRPISDGRSPAIVQSRSLNTF